MSAARVRVLRIVLGALPVMLLWPSLRHATDARMSLVMLVEFPMLLACGWAWSGALPSRWRQALSNVNAFGLASYTVALLVFTYWMIPSALDDALLSASAYAARHATWFIAGFALGIPARQPNIGMQLFFLGNAAWMAASAGLLYRESESRLCVNYLLPDQVAAGNGLVAAALLMLALAVLKAAGYRR